MVERLTMAAEAIAIDRGCLKRTKRFSKKANRIRPKNGLILFCVASARILIKLFRFDLLLSLGIAIFLQRPPRRSLVL